MITLTQTTVSVFLGIISGILTALLLGLLSIIFRKIILPWFESFVYRGVNVSGNWVHTKKEQSQTFEIQLELEQKAQRIHGSFQAKTNWLEKEKNEEYVNYYEIKGDVKDNYILLTYSAKRKDRTGVGAFLLRVSHGGTELIGTIIFTPDGNVEDHKIESRTNVVFKRN